jgi:hypothetical protein
MITSQNGQLDFDGVPNVDASAEKTINRKTTTAPSFFGVMTEPDYEVNALTASKQKRGSKNDRDNLKEQSTVITVPENCFNGIKTSCTGAEASNKFE